jgi:hypothetical protein
MTTIERSALGSATNALTTELNSLANGNTALSAAIDNSSVHALYHDLELVVTFGTAPAENTYVEVYLLPSIDGTNYDDGTAGTPGTVPRAENLVWAALLRNVTSAQRRVKKLVEVPAGNFKYLVRNQAGQSMAASGNTLKYAAHELSSA